MTATGKQAQVMAALFAHAKLMETQAPQLPVNVPEEYGFTPPEDGKYLRVSFFPNAPRWEGVTNGVMDQGLLQISIVWPKNQGLIAPGNAAAQVMAHFAKDVTLFNGTTRVKINGEPWLAVPITEESDVALPVTVPWAS